MIEFAWLMLCIWPVIGIVLFNKLSLPLACCVTIIGGFLILPQEIGIDLPILPELNKHSISVLTALVLSAVKIFQNTHGSIVLKGWVPREPVTLALLSMLVLGIFGTIQTNQDTLVFGPLVLPGMKLYDAFSFLLSALIMLVPFLLARRVLATPEAQRVLLLVLIVSALIYTLPALWEIRLSPQLHRQIYGYFTGSFMQQVRAGGFRPVVFVGHGLALSVFLCFAVLAAAGFYRASAQKNKARWGLALGWLFVVMVLTKSLGAVFIAVLLLPVVLFFTPRTQLLVAACIAGAVMTFPMLRAAGLVPVDRAMAFAESISVDRSRSLQVRLDNEEPLLERARQRPVFGWGGYSRNRVFDERGRNLSITDGSWILEMGVGGWVRYLAVFGLLCWPIIGLFISKRDRIDPTCTLLALLLCGKLIDLIPNSGMVPYVWLMAGALVGRLEIKLADLKQGVGMEQVLTGGAPPLGYARNFGSLSDPEPAAVAEPVMAASSTGPQYTRTSHKRHVRKK